MFATAAFPPWSVQSAIFQDLMTQTKSCYAEVEAADAHFQLSLCYQTGFGVEPDAREVLCHLRKAATVDPIAASVRRRLEIACNDQSLMKLDFATEVDYEVEPLMSSPLYFSTRLRLHQKSLAKITEKRTWKCDTVQFTLLGLGLLDCLSHRSDCHQPCVSSDPHGVILRRENLLNLAAEVGNPTLIHTLISNERWSEAELRSALLKACEYGNFVATELLSVHCPQLPFTSDKISPLHWLIMFDQDEARRLAVLLVLGSGGDIENANGICKDLVNVMPPPGSDPIIFPEHCLQLAGSPLHWAVGARNLALVTILVELGANAYQRWSPNRAPENDYPSHQHPGFTPLELAVAWHMPEIVDAFWKRTPSSLRIDLLESSDVPHYLGQLSLPFLRYIIHGANHVHAFNDTIHTLQAFAFDLCRRNKQGQSVLMAALGDPDQDIYMLQGILAASGSAERVTSDGKNAVTLVAATSLRRQNNPQRMELAMKMTTDINDTDDSGWNALHYLSVEDNATLCKMILRHGNLDINRQNAKGASAVHLAATFNAATVLVLLLHSGADIETWDQDGYTPLALAILNRRRSAIRFLVEAGANTFLRNGEGASKIGALHIAVSGPSSLDSIAAHLLETYPVFGSSSHLNLVDGFGWTPLHRAAYFGDYEGVAALLSYGADSEAQCCRRFPIAPGRTAFDVASNLLQKISTDSGLGSDHASIIKGGAVAIAAFRLRLEEVKLILTQKRGV